MKKLLSFIFACVVAISLFGCSGGDKSKANESIEMQIAKAKCVTEYSEDTTVDQMDMIMFGSYPQNDNSGKKKEPIEWIVLDKSDGKALLFSKKILDCQNYYDNDVRRRTTWSDSDLRKWLNSDFYNLAFSQKEKDIINLTKNNNNTYNSIPIFIYPSNGGEDTDDYVFCLSTDECIKYFLYTNKDGNDMKSQKLKESGYTNYSIRNMKADNVRYYSGKNENWVDVKYEEYIDDPNVEKKFCVWLRTSTPVTGTEDSPCSFPAYIVNGGVIGIETEGSGRKCKVSDCWETECSFYGGVRPAIWVNYESNSDVSFGTISGLPLRESEFRSDNHFYFDNNIQKSNWVYYATHYYHVDGVGNIEKNKWVDKRYVGADGKMYQGRQTPDGKWVGDDGYVVEDLAKDLNDSTLVKSVEPDSWYKTQSGLWYYFENDRTTTKKGWFNDDRDDQTYYFDPDTGIMATGWTVIDGDEYYFNEYHGEVDNWYETGDGFYESLGKKVKAYGSMYKNETTPDGKFVNEDGKVIE